MKRYISAACLIVIISFTAYAVDEVVIDRFSSAVEENNMPKGWKPLYFEKVTNRTTYTIEKEGGNYFVKAESNASASGIYKEVDIDPKIYNTIQWKWKAENILKKGDETKKTGDDYAARVYIIFRYDHENASLWEKTKYGAVKLIYGKYPPKAVLNYIWANKLPKGDAIDNAFTDRAKMMAVESGGSELGKWISEERNIYEDYKRLFKEEPPHIMGVAIMTDTDNTGESAVAYYDDILLMNK